MFEPVDGLPPLLAEYFLALNDHDIPRAMVCVSDDVSLLVEADPTKVVRAQGKEDFHEWVCGTLEIDSLAIAPVAVATTGERTSVQLAITAMRASGEAITLMQQVDYRIVNGLIVDVHAQRQRRRRERPSPRD